MTHRHTTLLAAIVLMCLPSLVHAMGMRPVWLGPPFLEGWVPEDVDAVRGVIVLNGWPNDGRWNEAAAYWKFAVLRINTDGYGADIDENDPKLGHLKKGRTAMITALVHGLRRLGEVTGHPEIEHVPLVTSGFSRYSPSAQIYMAAFPDRALCFLNGNGGGGDGDSAEQQLVWKQTPSQGLQCEWENILSGGDKGQLLDRWWKRPEGNLSMCGMTWRVYHNPHTFADLGIVFVDQVIQRRIPENWNPKKGPVKLRPVKFEEGWLGSHEGWRVPVEEIFKTDNENQPIAPYKKFKGDKARASWLISEEMAWHWRAFNSRYPLAHVIQPGQANIVYYDNENKPPVAHLECGVRAGVPFNAAVRGDTHNLAKIEFFANNIALGETKTFTGGEAPLGGTRYAVASIEATIEKPGIYGLMARYTTEDGTIGWTRPLPLVVWQAPSKAAASTDHGEGQGGETAPTGASATAADASESADDAGSSGS